MYQPGDVACPAEFPQKTLYYTDATDTRSCADACNCTASGGSCKSVVTSYSSSTCDVGTSIGTKNVFSTQELCVIADSIQSIQPSAPGVEQPGTCTPGGGATPVGSVKESGEATVCCSE